MDVEKLSAEDRDALAGELALGVLEGEERAAALRLMLADRAFAARVEQWRDYAGGLFDAVPEVAPPAGAWSGIAAQIGAANDTAPRALRWWRGGALTSGAVAAGLAALLLWRADPAVVTPAPDSAEYAVAQLSGPIEGLRIAARYDPGSASLRVQANGMPETPTEPELWVVPADGVPRSLGQIRRQGNTLIIVPEGHRRLINPSATLQLSMEPPSATPHAEPSSDMVAMGAIDLL
jgi:anti-sigma-K factor RskA